MSQHKLEPPGKQPQRTRKPNTGKKDVALNAADRATWQISALTKRKIKYSNLKATPWRNILKLHDMS